MQSHEPLVQLMVVYSIMCIHATGVCMHVYCSHTAVHSTYFTADVYNVLLSTVYGTVRTVLAVVIVEHTVL